MVSPVRHDVIASESCAKTDRDQPPPAVTLAPAHRNHSAALHKLPFELVSEVLRLVLASEGKHGARVRFLKSITAVSSRWRNFAVSMPELWTEIRYTGPVYTRLDNSRGFDAVFHRIITYLRRSKTFPIAITLGTQSTTLDDCRKLLNFVFPHLPRCHTLHLELHVARIVEEYLPLPGPLPLLRKARIGVDAVDEWSASRRFAIFDDENVSPICELKLRSSHRFQLSRIPTSGLKHFELDSHDVWEDIVEFLARCPALQTLTLYSDSAGHPATQGVSASDSPTTFTLPQLKSLALFGRLSMSVGAFMSTPNLHQLELGSDMGYTELRPITLPSPPPPPVRTLILREIVIPTPQRPSTAAFFRLFPTVTTLQFDDCVHLSEAMALLLKESNTAAETEVFPYLEFLRFQADYPGVGRILHLALKLLEQRPLLQLRLKCGNRPDDVWEREHADSIRAWGGRVARWDI